MPQNIPYPVSKYEKVLKNIRDASQEYSSALKKEIKIISFWLCEQDNESEDYSLKQNEDGNFSFYCDNDRVSIRNLAEKIQRYDERGVNIPPEQIIKDYLKEIEPLLKLHEIKEARVEEKVKTKMQQLEKILSG